jgi:hypothetical protein
MTPAEATGAMLRAAIARADGKGVPPLTGEMATRIARAGREGV